MKRIFLLQIVFWTVISCTSKSALINQQFQMQDFRIDGGISNISVVDKREKTDNRDLDIPDIPSPGSEDEVNPVLSPAEIDLIKSEIAGYFTGLSINYDIVVNIIQAKQRFYAEWTSENEQVYVTLEIILSDGLNKITCSGESFLFASSMDASNEFINEIYIKAFKLSINKALSYAKKYMAPAN